MGGWTADVNGDTMFEALDAVAVPLQSNGGGGSIVGILVLLFFLAVVVAQIAGTWKVFEKAGEPGWAAIVPVYNLYVMVKVAERPAWWTVLWFIPILALLPGLQVPVDIAKRFDKGVGYAVGLIFLPFVFFPLLGFGDANYRPSAA